MAFTPSNLVIPDGYPQVCTDDQIRIVMGHALTAIASTGYQANTVLELGPIITVGQAELQGRATDRITLAVARSAASSDRLARLALVLATAALIAAIAHVIIS